MRISANIGIIFVTYLYQEILGIRAIILATYGRISVGNLILSAIIWVIQKKNTRHCGVVLCHYQCGRSFIYFSLFDGEGMPRKVDI